MSVDMDALPAAALPSVTTEGQEAGIVVLKDRILEVMTEGHGFWRACTGCQEGEDGHVSARDYPYSLTFQCQPGGGCSECGGLGVVWDDTDYEQMAAWMVGDMQEATVQSGHLKRLDALHGDLAMFGANMRRDATDERSDGLIPYAESVKHFAGVLSEIIMDMVPEDEAATPDKSPSGIGPMADEPSIAPPSADTPTARPEEAK